MSQKYPNENPDPNCARPPAPPAPPKRLAAFPVPDVQSASPRREAGEEAAPCVTAGAGNGGPAHGARSGSAKDNLIVPHTVVGPLTAACGPKGHGGSGLATDKGAEAGHILAFGGNNTSGPIEQAAALNANRGCHNPGDFEAGTLLTVAQPLPSDTTHCMGTGSKDGMATVAVAQFVHVNNGRPAGRAHMGKWSALSIWSRR